MKDSPVVTDQAVRDQLALVRTKLANERTLLAYVRTAIMFAATGATLLKFFRDEPGMNILGWVLIAFATLVVTYGVGKYRKLLALLELQQDDAIE